MNALADIGDAVVSELTDTDWQDSDTPTFTAERVYVPRFSTTETGLKMFVCGMAEKPDLFGEDGFRNVCSHDYTVQVAILKRVDAGDRTGTDPVAELDDLSDFREQVIDLL